MRLSGYPIQTITPTGQRKSRNRALKGNDDGRNRLDRMKCAAEWGDLKVEGTSEDAREVS
jgi:hypothetical protein